MEGLSSCYTVVLFGHVNKCGLSLEVQVDLLDVFRKVIKVISFEQRDHQVWFEQGKESSEELLFWHQKDLWLKEPEAPPQVRHHSSQSQNSSTMTPPLDGFTGLGQKQSWNS